MDAKNRPVGGQVERELLWRAMRDNKDLWIETAWHIRQPRGRPRTPKLWPAQKELLTWYDQAPSSYVDGAQKYVSLKARQLGWTTITTAYAGHTMVFQEYMPWLIVSHNEDYAKKNLAMLKIGFNLLPEWIADRVGEVRATTERIELVSNGSTVESIPATGSSGRGDAIAGLIWDEGAYAPDAEGLYAALEPLTYWKLFLLSTANGMGNMFHTTYEGAKYGESEWAAKFIPWDQRPDRDETWRDRKARDPLYRSQPWLLYQEYPSNDVEAFARSGRTPISGELIDEYDWDDPVERMVWTPNGFEEPADSDDVESFPVVLDIWERPTVERDEQWGYALRPPNYVIFWDVAEGLVGGDASAVAVYNANTRECVARVQTNFPAEDLPEVVEWIGYWYHTALLAVERNNHGWGVLQILDRQLSYPRLYTMPSIASRKRSHSQTLGWHTNTATKPKMVSDFARELRNHTIFPRDPTLRYELRTFVQDEQGRYGASEGNHDDVVIAHMGAVQVMEEVHRFPVVWRDDEFNRVTTMDEIDAIADGLYDDVPYHADEIGGVPHTEGKRASFWVTPV